MTKGLKMKIYIGLNSDSKVFIDNSNKKLIGSIYIKEPFIPSGNIKVSHNGYNSILNFSSINYMANFVADWLDNFEAWGLSSNKVTAEIVLNVKNNHKLFAGSKIVNALDGLHKKLLENEQEFYKLKRFPMS